MTACLKRIGWWCVALFIAGLFENANDAWLHCHLLRDLLSIFVAIWGLIGISYIIFNLEEIEK